MTKQIKIDLFSDPACPWCLVGLQRLDNTLAKLPAGVEVDIEHHPYLLDSAAKIEGEDVVAMLTEKYGKDPSEMWGRLEEEAKKSGLDLDMHKQKIRYATQPAQALIKMARASGNQHQVAVALSKANYMEARNIADPDVLVEIGVAHGLEADAVREAVTNKDAHAIIETEAFAVSQQGIQGVPFFIFMQKYAFSGAQPEDVFQQALDTVIAELEAA